MSIDKNRVHLEALISTIPDLIFIFDKNEFYLEVYTHQPEKLYMPAEEFIGKKMSETLPESVYLKIKPIFLKAIETNKLQTTRYNLFINNETLYFEARVQFFDNDKVMWIVRDITHEEKLKQIDSKWEFAIDSIGDGLWDWDMVTDVVFYSKRFKEMLGYKDSELENHLDTFFELLHPEDSKLVEEHIDDYLNDKVSKYEIEFRLKNKNGVYQWILARGKVLKDSDGNPIRFAGSHTDINDKKIQQIQKEDLERRWEFALDSSGDGIWDWNVQTNKVFYSKRWKLMLGYENDEISDSISEWESRVHPDDLGNIYKLLNSHFEGYTETYILKHRVLCKDGSYKWILDRGKVIEKDNDGNPLRVIGTHTDIDELINTQKELERQSILLNDAQNIAQMGAWKLDLKTGKTIWTDEVYNIHEVDKDFDHNKINGIEFYHPDYRPIISNAINNTIKTKQPFYEVCKFITAKGNEKWVIASGRVVEENDNIEKLIGMFQDITIEKNNKVELEKTKQRLESILNEINDVVWSVSLPEYKMLFVSPSAVTLYGYPIEDWMNNSNLWEEIIHDNDKHVIEKIANSFKEYGGYSDIVYRIITKDGEVKWINNSARIIKGENGATDRIDGIVKDITQQKIQENEIRYKESLYNSFIQLAPLGIALNDFKTGKFIEVNDKLVEPTGYSKLHFMNLSYWDLTPKEYDSEEEKQLENLNKYGFYGPYKKEYIKKDGSRYSLLLNGIKITDMNGKELIWSIIEDISEKIKKEKEIKEKTNYMELAEKTAKLGYWVVDLVNGTAIWSDETKRIHEVPLDYIPDLETAINFYAPEVIDQVKNVVENAIKTGKGWEFDLPIITAKNNRVWVNAIADVIQENGVTTKIFGTFQNITDRKKLQVERDNIFNLSLDMISVCGPDGFFKQLNHAWSETLEYSIEELTSKPLWDFIHPDDIKITELIFADVMNKPVLNFENRYITKSGKIVWFSWSAQINPVDNLIYSITRNISETKKREEELEKAKLNAEQANKTKSIFLANMSHEIRTPLNSILGFGDLLLNKLEQEDNIQYVSSMISAGKTLLTLINDILDLSKIEANKLTTEIKESNPKKMISELSQIFSHLASKKNLSFKTIISENLPESLLFDEIRTRQILLNLLGNALKFTDEGIIVFKIDFEIIDENHIDLRISVEDSGIGIKQSNLEIIFDEFRQQDDQSTRKYGGTGLGLTISKRLANMLGGKINVESKENIGSTFTLTLNNLEFKQQKQIQNMNKYDIIFQDEEILIVDDNELNILLLQTILNNLGLKNIRRAYTGEEAINMIKESKPKLVLIDIQMPVMDGIQATNFIKNDLKINVPIIALTALAMQHNIDENSIYFDDYLTKPIESEKLVEALKKHVGFTESKKNITNNKSKINLNAEEINQIKSHFTNNIIDNIENLELDKISDICDDLLNIIDNPNIINYLTNVKQKANNFDIDDLKDLIKQII